MHATMFVPILAPTVFAGSAHYTALADPGPDQEPMEPFAVGARALPARGEESPASDGPTSASQGAVRPRTNGA